MKIQLAKLKNVMKVCVTNGRDYKRSICRVQCRFAGEVGTIMRDSFPVDDINI